MLDIKHGLKMLKKRIFNFSAYVIFWAATFILILMVFIPKISYQIANNSVDADIDVNRTTYKDLQDMKLKPYNHSFEIGEIRRKWNNTCPWEIFKKTNNRDAKTVVFVPYRNRTENLKLFLSPIHEHLINQVRCGMCIILSYIYYKFFFVYYTKFLR